jgi:ribosomal protein L36
MKWVVTKRRDNDYIVRRDGDLRGICTTWEQDHAERIAAALNTAPFPGTPAEALDSLRLAGSILAASCQKMFSENWDIVQLSNALTYWDLCVEKIKLNAGQASSPSIEKGKSHE